MLRVIMAHSYYREQGGENHSFEAESSLLREQPDVEIETFVRRHDGEPGPIGKAGLAARSIWALEPKRDLEEVIRRFRPDLVHFQNTFPLLSPSVYEACKRHDVAVVQHLRNYRLLCPSANFYRDGRPCELCLGKKVPRHGVVHACYQGSRVASLGVATMLTIHNLRGTWHRSIDAFISPTEFTRAKYVEAGFPGSKIFVKPNFVHPDPGIRHREGTYALFVGRLAPEKGLETLLRAWIMVPDMPLKVVGLGSLSAEAETAVQRSKTRVEFLGAVPNREVLELVKGARLVVFPSEWYETFGRVVIEALACEVPIVSSRIGAMQELIRDRETGLLFTPGDERSLADAVAWSIAHPDRMTEIARAGRIEYERRFTADVNAARLKAIYSDVLAGRPSLAHES